MTTELLEKLPQLEEYLPLPAKDSWGKVFFYTGGKAYGVAADGRTICLGYEDIIKTVIADPELCFDIPVFDQVVNLERELIAKEKVNGKSGNEVKPSRPQRVIRTGGIRIGLATHTKHKPVDTRHLAVRKRVSGNKAQQSSPGISYQLGI